MNEKTYLFMREISRVEKVHKEIKEQICEVCIQRRTHCAQFFIAKENLAKKKKKTSPKIIE